MTNATDHSGRSTDHSGRSAATVVRVTAALRRQVDDHIVDRAAALFARHGFAQTSVQAVADAVGLSKAGLLHHFSSKQALWDAVLVHAAALGESACDAVADLPPGRARDLRAVEVLADIALSHPGLVALLLAPDDADLLIDRSVASAGLERYQDAVEDLGLALNLDPSRTDALVFRAAARRHLGQLDLAADDLGRAVAADPDNPDALLERGILRQRRGDPAGARQDWDRAATLAPDTATGDLALQNLALLDAGSERR